MRYIALAALAAGIGIVPIPQGFGEPQQRIVQRGGAASAKKLQEPTKGQQSADSQALQAIASAIAQANQQHADELKAAADEKNEDITIQGCRRREE